jgi:hypothetical protein
VDVAEQICEVLAGGQAKSAVNFWIKLLLYNPFKERVRLLFG